MSFGMLALATLVAFGCFVGFETTLASVDARATALNLEIAGQTQTLKAEQRIEHSAGAIESQIVTLHLSDSLRRQIGVLFGDLEVISHKRNVQVTAFRHEGNARFEVAVDGEYPAVLGVLADLGAAHVATQATRVRFERAKGHVRAAFSLDVLSLGDGSARPHVP